MYFGPRDSESLWGREPKPIPVRYKLLLASVVVGGILFVGRQWGWSAREAQLDVQLMRFHAYPIERYPYSNPIGVEFVGPSVNDRTLEEFVENSETVWTGSEISLVRTEATAKGIGRLSDLEYVRHLRIECTCDSPLLLTTWFFLSSFPELEVLTVELPENIEFPIDEVSEHSPHLKAIEVNGKLLRVFGRNVTDLNQFD